MYFGKIFAVFSDTKNQDNSLSFFHKCKMSAKIILKLLSTD